MRRFKNPLIGRATLALAGCWLIADLSMACAQKTEPQTQSNAQLMQTLNVLHSTKVVLEGADHDYGGHRAAAVKAIGAAQHQLRLALGIKAPSGKGPKKDSPMPEPQNVSNTQLAEAIPVLKEAITTLKGANHDYHGHRANAVRDLEEAKQQLEMALKYEKKKESGGQ
jgi:hypothetical protein